MAVYFNISPIKTMASYLVFITLISQCLGLDIAYCSFINTGSAFAAVYNMYQSNGACYDTCKSSYAYAVLSGPDCWCANYTPVTSTTTSDCDVQCPGFGSDWCGNAAIGLYAYIAISGHTPLGLAGASSSSQSTSSSAIVVPSTTTTPTPTPAAPTTSSTSVTSANSPTSTSLPPTQIYTSVTTVTGQVRTILVTPTSPSDSTLGSNSSGSGGGVSAGKVAGIVVGVALGLGLLIGFGVWFWLRRRHRRAAEVASVDAHSTHGVGNNSVPSRQVSQMSSAGLLGKPPRILTAGLATANGPKSPESSQLDRRSLGTDQRLNPYAIYAHEESRLSNVSLQDNQDYSRQLRVANPDP